jgi:protein ImuB
VPRPSTDPRIACLFVPDFRLQVGLQELGGEPEGGMALVDPDDGRRLIVAASPGARLDGVRRGMTAVAATAMAPELTVREVDLAALAAAHTRLEEAVRGVAPSFETTGGGVLYAAFAGLELRYGIEGEGGFLDDLREVVRGLDLPARVGIAGTRFCARAAAILEGRIPSRGPAAIQVEPGLEGEFLDPLPLELLPDALVEIDTLRRLGIRTLGDFARLPASGVVRRFGDKGLALQRLARGEDRRTLVPAPEPRRFVVRVSAEYPIVQTEALRFLLRRPLERLIGELDGDGLAARCIRWTMQIEGADPVSGTTWSASPSASLRLWIDLWGVELERLQLPGGVLSVELEADEVAPRSAEQERLTGPRAVPPGALSMTLAHLAAEVGPEGYGTLAPSPGPWPEQRQTARAFPATTRLEAEPWVPDRVRPGELAPAFRRVCPPEPIRVELNRGCLVGFRLGRGWFPVERTLGPWEISGGWWRGSGGARRCCYQVEGRGAVAHLFFDPDGERWFLAGWLD